MDLKNNSLSLLDDAKKTYTKIADLLSSTGKEIEARLGKEEFSSERFLKQFDFLLQLVLLKTGIADGHLSEKEAQAIESIPQHGDLLEIFKGTNFENPLGWKQFVGASVEELAAITLFLDEKASSLFENFFYPIALYDHQTGKEEFFSMVAHSIHAIANDLSGIDGLKEDSERLAAYQALMTDVRESYDHEIQVILSEEKPDGQA